MSLFEENIQSWIITETSGLIDGRLKKLPNISSISKLTQGKNKEIWKFVIKHVKSKQSVAFVRKILETRQAVKEREKYPDTDKTHLIILKNKVEYAENKVRFLEHHVDSIIKHISSLDTSVKNQAEENCILHQKCSLLELTTLNFKEKNESLNLIISKLYVLLNKSFANEKTKCFPNIVDHKSSKITTSKVNLSDDNVKNIISEIILVVNQKLLGENLKSPLTNFAVPVAEIMNYSLTVDLVNLLKHISQQDLNVLESNAENVKQKDIGSLSESYLQSMKQDLLDSCFQRKKIENAETKSNNVHISEGIGKLQKDFLLLHIQNEGLTESIQYLEKQLANELNQTNTIKENNLVQKSQCEDIDIIMGDFYKKLNVLHELFDQMPKASMTIKSSLESCRMFINSKVLSTIKCNSDDCIIHVANKIDDNYKSYLVLLRNKEFLEDFLKDFTFVHQNFPPKIWEFLGIEPFQNHHLLLEKLIHIKTKLSMEPNRFYKEEDAISASLIKQMISSVQENIDRLEMIMKNLYDVGKSCKNLNIVLKDWWQQDAQYIPSIQYHGKTLAMWLAILNVME